MKKPKPNSTSTTHEQSSLGPGYQQGKWWVPNANLDYRDPPHRPRPRSIELFDVTLREGPQHYPIILDADDMVRLAEASASLGVKRIDVWPVVSEATRAAMKRIAATLPQLEMFCPFRPNVLDDLDQAEQHGARGVVLLIPSIQPAVLQRSPEPDYSHRLDAAWKAAETARSRGLRVVAGTGGSFRPEPEALASFYRGAANAGVEAVTIADSLGAAAPWAVESLVRKVRDWVGPDMRIEIHCHNDLGLATANSLAAVQAGADVVHAALNGYGERAGNASLEEVAVGAEALLGVSTGLDLSRLTEVCRLAAEITRVPLSHNKPVVGSWQSVGWTGLQVEWRRDMSKAGYPEAWFAVMPDVVGAEPGRFELGPMVGGGLVKLKAEELDLDLPDELVPVLRDDIKRISTERHTPIGDTEFRQMVEAGRQRLQTAGSA
ncbi:MAG TPA: LeuA family protein [Chloroflexota bacterium]|nr:LeuA family protein [Chloroflexota bacterium]